MAKEKKKAGKKKVSPPSKKTVAKKATKQAKKKAVKKGKKKGDDLMCFLTTACVSYYSLPDNCYELNTLRKYRDTYLTSSEAGRDLIRNYYSVSPKIVKLVEKDKEKPYVYEYIYSEVKSACLEIEKENFLSAKHVYQTMVKSLMKRYDLN